MLGAGSDIFDPTQWINFGVTGVVIIALVFGWLWAKPSVDQIKESNKVEREQSAATLAAERARAEKAEAQRDEAFQIAQEKILPLLNQFVNTTSVLMPLLQDLVQRRERRDD